MAVYDSMILFSPYVLVMQQSAPGSLVPVDGTFQYGVVVKVFETCERVDVGDYVLFNPAESRALQDSSGSKYYLVNETLSFFKEILV